MTAKESLKRTAYAISYLVYARSSMRKSKETLASHLGISLIMLSRYENGYAIPPLPLLLCWCDALGVKPAKVLDPEISQIPETETQARLIYEMYEVSKRLEEGKETSKQMELF